MKAPTRGEVYVGDLDPTRGREQAGMRPVLVVSQNLFNAGRAELVIVVPLTTTDRGVRSHVPVDPPEAGLSRRSFVMCEAVRSVAKGRLGKRLGAVGPTTMSEVDDRLRILLDL